MWGENTANNHSKILYSGESISIAPKKYPIRPQITCFFQTECSSEFDVTVHWLNSIRIFLKLQIRKNEYSNAMRLYLFLIQYYEIFQTIIAEWSAICYTEVVRLCKNYGGVCGEKIKIGLFSVN